eukprot:6948773-Alexandrium_andersonii.AAC.1
MFWGISRRFQAALEHALKAFMCPSATDWQRQNTCKAANSTPPGIGSSRNTWRLGSVPTGVVWGHLSSYGLRGAQRQFFGSLFAHSAAPWIGHNGPNSKRSELEMPDMRNCVRRSELELRGPKNSFNIDP